MAIISFSDKETERFYRTGKLKKGSPIAHFRSVALRKLDMLHYANELKDLKSPPQNRLESLKGNLKGFHSIRINDQWRIIFIWSPAGLRDVSIVDYH